MLEFYNTYILPKNRSLGMKLGTVERVVVKQIISKPTPIPVKYIKAVNPWGEEVLVSEQEMAKAEELGLSLRRIV